MKTDDAENGVAALEQLRAEKFPEIHPDEKVWCLHCDRSFEAGRVLRYFAHGRWWLRCPNGSCNGSALDWDLRPWWRGKGNEEDKVAFNSHVSALEPRCSSGRLVPRLFGREGSTQTVEHVFDPTAEAVSEFPWSPHFRNARASRNPRTFSYQSLDLSR